MLRIIDKSSGLFLRDDFECDEELELAIDVDPAQGLYRPRWNGESWEEAMTPEEIQAIKDSSIPEPTEIEKLTAQVTDLQLALVELYERSI